MAFANVVHSGSNASSSLPAASQAVVLARYAALRCFPPDLYESGPFQSVQARDTSVPSVTSRAPFVSTISFETIS